ncbi:MAG TPA: sugar ABC transporter ATP-binding protein, partial [Acetobacteraceae bacterium]|nr:sugar ABC transporter ATP-binding protein [Acetobacteraceae bacterium]
APDLPVWENIFLGAERTRAGFVDRGRSRREAACVLGRLCDGIDVDALAGDLPASGQQLVEVARALAREPRLLILDEPTAPLAAAEVGRLFDAVRTLTRTGVAVIFISHRLAEVEAICDEILVLRNGRCAGSWETSGQLDERRILDLMTGDPEAQPRPPMRRTQGEPVLTTTGLGAGIRVRGVDLVLHAGEIVGLSGLQGQGQEELLEILAGARRADAGSIRHRGQLVSARTPRDMIRRRICLVPNDRHRQGLFMGQSVGENLTYASVAMQKKPWHLPLARLRQAALGAIAQLGIKTTGPDQSVAALSGGNQQKVVVGKWLALEPDVLLLSDPTKGVDVHARTEIYALLDALALAGSAILVYASDLQELLRHCDRILVMYEGRIAGELSGATMNEHHAMAASFGRAA